MEIQRHVISLRRDLTFTYTNTYIPSTVAKNPCIFGHVLRGKQHIYHSFATKKRRIQDAYFSFQWLRLCNRLLVANYAPDLLWFWSLSNSESRCLSLCSFCLHHPCLNRRTNLRSTSLNWTFFADYCWTCDSGMPIWKRVFSLSVLIQCISCIQI